MPDQTRPPSAPVESRADGRATMAMHAKYYRDDDGGQQETACWCQIQEDHWRQDPEPVDDGPDHDELTAGDQTQVPVPTVQRPQGATFGASASVAAETDPGDGRSDLRVDLALMLRKALLSRWPATPPDAYLALVDAILAAGWRPPLPEQSEGPSPWDAYVAAFREYQETDPHGATAHPTAHHMHAVEAALRVYDPCAEHGDLIHRFVAASLEFDYTAEGECGGVYDDDAAEREAAIANIAEMHRLLNVRAERLAEAHEKLRAASSPLPDSEQRGVWQSPDGVHLAVEAEDGELEWLECDAVGGWLLRGMLDMVPDEWVRLVPLPDSETENAVVVDFCAERAQYVTALKHNTDGGADYHRWQGHAEARRQLSERLGREVTS